MNESGRAIAKAYRKIGGENWGRLCIVHDDLELPVGTTKLRTMGMGKYIPVDRVNVGVITV